MGEKQQWSIEQQKCLLECCIEEVTTVGRKGMSLHRDSWTKVAKVLKERFNLDLNKKQLKNTYDNLKAKYVGWVYLKNKTDNIYNPHTNTFTLTNEEWEEFKKGHPKAAALKTVPLPFPELCAQLFDGATATGNGKWTSTQTSGVGSSSFHRNQPLLLSHDTEENSGTFHHTSEPTFEPTFEPSPERTHEPSPGPNPNKRAKKGPTVDELAIGVQSALEYLIKGKEGPSVVDCSEKLKQVGLEPVDPIFLAAFHIFGKSSDMREAWMVLPDIPKVLRGWIVMTAKTLGVIN